MYLGIDEPCLDVLYEHMLSVARLFVTVYWISPSYQGRFQFTCCLICLLLYSYFFTMFVSAGWISSSQEFTMALCTSKVSPQKYICIRDYCDAPSNRCYIVLHMLWLVGVLSSSSGYLAAKMIAVYFTYLLACCKSVCIVAFTLYF